MSNCDIKSQLCSWGLPEAITEYYHEKGIDQFFAWQVECLSQPGVLESNNNLVYSAPTSAGKSLVADVLLYRTMLKRKKKSIVIMPYIAMAEEKVHSMRQLFGRIGGSIVSFAGPNSNAYASLDRVDVAVCTIEKANIMINRLIEEKRIAEVGLIVADELHLLGDPNRGFLLELLLAKVLHDMKSDHDSSESSVQIVGMSATIANLPSIAQWLNAQMYETNFRPIPLTEKMICNNKVYLVKEDRLKFCNTVELDLEDALISSSIETMSAGHSTLIFCNTIEGCEKTSRSIAREIVELINQNDHKLKEFKAKQNQNKIDTLLCALKQTTNPDDFKLFKKTIPFGVAFHHARLLVTERSLIEQAFRDGTLRILCSTSTLAAGVNLPVRRVLMTFAWHFKVTNYRHMIGRAGRMGIDDRGESILFCEKKDFEKVKNMLIHTELPPIKSCLLSENSNAPSFLDQTQVELPDNLKQTILEAISNGTVTCYSELDKYMKYTFFFTSVTPSSSSDLNNTIEQVVQYLTTNRLIYHRDPSRFMISQLGKAIVASGMPRIDQGIFIAKGMNKARQKFSMLSDLHLICLLTPIYSIEYADFKKINWSYYRRIWHSLSPEFKSVAKLIGANEEFLDDPTSSSEALQFIHKRFYASLALNDLVHEMPLLKVANKYGISKVTAYTLQQDAVAFAGMLTIFCAKLGWNLMKSLLEQFKAQRLSATQFEAEHLKDLMRISFFNPTLAQKLYEKGFDSLRSIVESNEENIEDALISTSPFEMQISNDTSLDHDSASDLEFDSIAPNRIDPTESEIFVPKLDEHVPIRKLSKIILNNARMILEENVEENLAFRDGISSQVSVQPNTSNSRLSLKRPLSVDSSMEDLSDLNQNSHQSNNQNVSSFFRAFSANQLEHCAVPLAFDPKLTSKIAIDKYEQIEVKTELQCQQLLEEIFCEDISNSEPGAVLDIAVYFRLLATDTNEQGLLIEKPYPMLLSELNFARLGHSRVFQLKSIDMFKCLQMKLSSWLDMFDSSFRNNETFNENSKPRFRFLTYDIKKTLYLFEFGFNLPNQALMHKIDWHDLSVAIWLLDPDTKRNIEELSVKDLDASKFPLNAMKKSLLKTAILFHLTGQFCHKLFQDNLYKSYKLIELPARLCLYLLQIRGIRIDHEFLEIEQNRISWYIQNLEEQIFEMAGKKFNLNRRKEYSKILEDKLALTSYLNVQKSSKTASNSVLQKLPNKLTLEKLQEACGVRIKLRTLYEERSGLKRVQSLVLNGIKKELSFDNQNAFVYCKCNEWTATGRIMLRKPNLIGVNKDFDLTEDFTDDQLELDNCEEQNEFEGSIVSSDTIQLRKIICARENYVLVSADYSQLELRILAHFTQDPALLKTLNDPSSDVFKSIAASWKNIPTERVTPEMRQQAKQICYGINYGIGDKKLAERLEVTQNEATEFRNNFLARYPQIQKFIDRVVEGCRVNSYVETISQRRRMIANISSNDQLKKWKGQRQAVNTTIQGSAADIFKLAMISVEQEIDRNGFDASLVMQMHDELMYEVRHGQVNPFSRLLKQQMELMSRHLDNVILLVKVRSGPNWGSLQDINYDKRESIK